MADPKMHFAVWRRSEGDFGTIVGYRSACGQGYQRAINTDAVDCLQCKSTDAFKAALVTDSATKVGGGT